MLCDIEDLLNVLARNRRWHGNSWKKVRRDRLHKLVSTGCVDQVVQIAVETGKLRLCQKEVELPGERGTVLVEAVRLSGPEYLSRIVTTRVKDER